MKQQKKFPEHIRSPRRTRRSAAKTVSFGDAAALYIEYSKAVTSAETVVKRMRYFAQFYNTAFAERDLAGICPSDIYLWFDGVLVAKRRDGKSGYAPRTLRSIWGQLYTFFHGAAPAIPSKTPCTPSKCPAPAPRNAT